MTEVIHFVVRTLAQLIILIGCIVAAGRLYVLLLGKCFNLDRCKAGTATFVIAAFLGWLMLAGITEAHDSLRQALSDLCYLVAIWFGARQVWAWRQPIVAWVKHQFDKGDCGCGRH